MNRFRECRIKLTAVEVLRLLKVKYTYRELARMTGLPIPVLSRYVKGHVLPALTRSEELIRLFGVKYLQQVVAERIRLEDGRVFDDSSVLRDTNLLDKVGKVALQAFADVEVDKVLTAEVDGIVLAANVAREFGADIIVARGRKEMGVKDFVEVRRIFTSGTYSYLFIPKGSIVKGERVILVDDAVRTGSTMETMYNMCMLCEALPIGAFTLVCFREVRQRLAEKLGVPMKVLVEYESSP